MFAAVHRLSLGASRGGYSLVAARGLLVAGASLGVEHGLCVWASAVVAHRPTVVGLRSCWCTGLAALWHVESPRIGDQICVPCIGRRIIYQRATREIPFDDLFLFP